jgi:glycosyltransferase involved in cell wall biosynthesis
VPLVSLVATLEHPLPATLPAGTATAMFVYGSCGEPVEISVDGVRHPAAWVRGRFWAVVPVTVRAGAVEIGAAKSDAVVPLARIEAGPSRQPPSLGWPAPEGLIAVCMATFEPDMVLFRTQVESLRAQTDERWICVVSDDASAPEHYERIRAELGDDPRFLLSRAEDRMGFYRNFERALALAPAEAELIALCDQDDRWRPDKLAVLRAALGGAGLVYSDMRLVDADGRVLRDTLWQGRANNHTDLVSMLVANSITGAAMLMRREVTELALPFPDIPTHTFHDAWLAAVALTAGDVAYVDRPLYDYVQHRGAFFGAVTHGPPPTRRWSTPRGSYFRGYLPRVVLAEVLLARAGGRLAPAKRGALQRFIRAERSVQAFLWLAARTLRVLAGRTETLGSESGLLPGIVWRRLAGILRLDASLPDLASFEQPRLRRWRARV